MNEKLGKIKCLPGWAKSKCLCFSRAASLSPNNGIRPGGMADLMRTNNAAVVKLAYTRHSKCRGSNPVSVRLRPAAHRKILPQKLKNLTLPGEAGYNNTEADS